MEIKRNTYLYADKINESTFRLRDIFGNSTTVNNGAKLYNIIANLKDKPLSYYTLVEERKAIENEVEFLYDNFQISMASWLECKKDPKKYYCRNAIANYDDDFYSGGRNGFFGAPASPLFKFNTNVDLNRQPSRYLNADNLRIVLPATINCGEGGIDHTIHACIIKGANEKLETSIMRCDITETDNDILLNGHIYTAIIK